MDECIRELLIIYREIHSYYSTTTVPWHGILLILQSNYSEAVVDLYYFSTFFMMTMARRHRQYLLLQGSSYFVR
jgi:hypothetical protein